MNTTTPPPTLPIQASACPAPALDAAAMARLRELDPGGKSGVIQRVLVAYEASLQRVLSLVQEQAVLPTPDPQVLMDNAHMLKSSSASVGALDLARLCEGIEARTRASQSAEHRDCERFIQEMQRALAAVQSQRSA
jgi:HPt (histidine-containing phosphotransfer) domain-containing protein